MEMKEFYYHDGIRISLFNLDHEAVSFHSHTTVTDIMCCVKGIIHIELPDTKKVYRVIEDQIFQVPSKAKHRFTNGNVNGKESRYVLLQVGNFDIDFLENTHDLEISLQGVKLKNVIQTEINIDRRNDDIINIAKMFSREKPVELTFEERDDVVKALEIFASKGN